MESINIELIMEEIRNEIKAKGYTNDMLSFEDVVASNTKKMTMEDYYDILNNTWNIPAYRVLSGNAVKIFIKKVLRKLMSFYVEPIAMEQTAFNANNVRLLNKINTYMEMTDRKMELLEIEVEQLKKQLSENNTGDRK